MVGSIRYLVPKKTACPGTVIKSRNMEVLYSVKSVLPNKLKEVANLLACIAARLPPIPLMMGKKAMTLGYLSATLLMMTPTPLEMSMAVRMGHQPWSTAGLAYLLPQEKMSKGGIRIRKKRIAVVQIPIFRSSPGMW